MPKTPAKPSYSLVGDLHGMQGVSGSKKSLKRIITSEIIRKIINKIIYRDILFHGSMENNTFFDFSNINKKILDELFTKTSLYWREACSKKDEMYYSVLTKDKYKKTL